MDKTIKPLAKEKFLAALENLPEEKVKELLDFTESLLSREKAKKLKPTIDPDKDPILGLIRLTKNCMATYNEGTHRHTVLTEDIHFTYLEAGFQKVPL